MVNLLFHNHPVFVADRLPVKAWKPVLIADTVLVDPQDSHCKKNKRFSFVRIVSADLQVLQVTYSTELKELNTNVPFEHVLNLLLLETTLDDQTLISINTAACS